MFYDVALRCVCGILGNACKGCANAQGILKCVRKGAWHMYKTLMVYPHRAEEQRSPWTYLRISKQWPRVLRSLFERGARVRTNQSNWTYNGHAYCDHCLSTRFFYDTHNAHCRAYINMYAYIYIYVYTIIYIHTRQDKNIQGNTSQDKTTGSSKPVQQQASSACRQQQHTASGQIATQLQIQQLKLQETPTQQQQSRRIIQHTNS